MDLFPHRRLFGFSQLSMAAGGLPVTMERLELLPCSSLVVLGGLALVLAGLAGTIVYICKTGTR